VQLVPGRKKQCRVLNNLNPIFAASCAEVG
jgi:hypothetical protein